MTERPCNCGSTAPRYALTDAAGIFCAYVCESCEDKVRARYRPSIFDGCTAYASTGEEADLDRDDFDGF